jgi:hypothetical protein
MVIYILRIKICLSCKYCNFITLKATWKTGSNSVWKPWSATGYTSWPGSYIIGLLVTHLRLALPARQDKILSPSIIQPFFFSQGDSIEEYTPPPPTPSNYEIPLLTLDLPFIPCILQFKKSFLVTHSNVYFILLLLSGNLHICSEKSVLFFLVLDAF